MKLVKLVVFATLIFGLGACSGIGKESVVGTYDESYSLEISRGRNIVAPLVRRGSGVAVAVGVDGKLVWSEGFGYASLERDAMVEPESKFQVYSLMKQVTTILALQSSLKRELGLTTSIRELMPELAEHMTDISALQLLTHTSGIRHYNHPSEALMTQHCTSATEALPLFVDDPLVSTPGSKENYSSFGFILVSALLERAANMSFPELLNERILKPVGMSSTILDSEDAKPMSYYDVSSDGEVLLAPDTDNSCKMGAGGFLASAEDIVNFHNAVLKEELVPMAAILQMMGQRSSLEAGGSGAGGEAVSIVDLENKLSIVILSNTGGLEQRLALGRVRELLQGVFTADRNSAEDIASR